MNFSDVKAWKVNGLDVKKVERGGVVLWEKKTGPSNQLIPNGNFADTSFWAFRRVEFVDVTNNVATLRCIEAQNNTNNISNRLCAPINLTNGHKYYVCADMKLPKGTRTTLYIAQNDAGKIASIIDIAVGAWKRYDAILTSNLNITGNGYRDGIWYGLKGDAPSVVGDIYYVKNCMCVDLTAMYGAGNEPTKEQFRSEYTEDYYPYKPL